ncbi:hypothetical protein SEENIN0B_04117 [Salmonella enterica subsp. enterica serovar Infantis str. SARB27]|uniref:Uncharacterized protein n=1 Tax=Salmonella enterica subsp. enterica serovar Infantis str. SARB27 TaxID=596155 RepID=A0A6C8G4H7_SALIN|nr:hypothetical protein SEENIN0B_04117 [Salmonella enterica subsp. enterica serovar Infantis str. SARB27]
MLKRNRKSRVKCNNAEMRYTCRFLTQAASFFFLFFLIKIKLCLT